MKKVYLLLSLFIIPVFFFSIGEVRAETYSNVVPETDFDYIDDDFLTFRELLIEYCNQNNKKYIISLNASYQQYAYVFDEDNTANNYSIKFSDFGSFTSPVITLKSYTPVRLSDDKTSIHEFSSSTTTTYIYFSSRIGKPEYCETYGCTFSLRYYRDTNLDFIYTYNASGKILIFTYNNLSYELSDGTPPPTLYQIYTDINSGEEDDKPVASDKFIEEQELMNNFYSTIFTKIGDLAANFASNYTFLLIFGIMILIFVIELIRRYLL